MSKKRKDKLLLNLLEGKRYKHRVAMVNEESGWNQHEPNSGMARMFVIMLLIHVVVIGGIIIYDFMNGDAAAAHAVPRDRDYSAGPVKAPPQSPSAVAVDNRQLPVEEYTTYEWRSGDSLPLVAQKLGVAEDVLIKLNMLDKGTQIDQHTILRYPRRQVVKALAINPAPTHAVAAAKTPLFDESPPAHKAAKGQGQDQDKAKGGSAMNLTPPGGSFSFEPTIMNRLTPTPSITPGQAVQDAPPAAKPSKDDLPTAASLAVKPNASPAKIQDKIPEKSPDVVKAVPIARQAAMAMTSDKEKEKEKERDREKEKEREKPVIKKVADSPPSGKSEASSKSARGTYVVKPGETLYRIANKHGVSVAALQKANNISKPESLRDGMKLVIPVK